MPVGSNAPEKQRTFNIKYAQGHKLVEKLSRLSGLLTSMSNAAVSLVQATYHLENHTK